MQKIKQLIIITAAIALILPIGVLAESPPMSLMPPIIVYGTVTIDGNIASSGTVSAAGVSSNIGSDGKYSINVPFENAGSILTYKVNGAIAAQVVCVNPQITPTVHLDLSITTAAPTTTANTGSISAGNTSGGSSSSNTNPPSPPAQPAVKKDEPLAQEPKEEVVVLGVEADYRAIQLDKIINEAGYIWKGDASVIAGDMAVGRDPKAEVSGYNKYTASLISGISGLEQFNIYAITNFIVYGTPTTEILGAGERAGVLNSYKSAFGKLPTTQSEWEDAIKIANGRWPNERSEAAENKAKSEFKKVYKREPNMDNPNDNAAVTVIAYGLRPDSRNLDSEKAGILTFKHIYRYNPSSAVDWDVVRAIAYSGAVR
ncbi:hypothetical protein L6249_01115 [Candidatus Parcubacteria bacterium]|nr:hypothetical protein [Candidatus Parcubacteria bacterium]